MIRVDGKTVYACTTRLAEREMTLEPLPNKTLLKDLVTEIAPPDERLRFPGYADPFFAHMKVAFICALLISSRLGKRLGRLAGSGLRLTLRQRLTCLEEPLHIELSFPRELVHEPDGHCRLPQRLDLFCPLALALRAQPFDELAASRCEFAQRPAQRFEHWRLAAAHSSDGCGRAVCADAALHPGRP